MSTDFDKAYDAIRGWAEQHRIRVGEQTLAADRAGEFDGVSVTMNRDYPAEERAYYLVHALGSIVRWSLDQAAVQRMFDELRDALETKRDNPERLERSLVDYQAFETESSSFSVWLLGQLNFAEIVASYTNFMRADLESMSIFHHKGRAPVWREFFAQWNDQVAAGRPVPPFTPKSIPQFEPCRIELQMILQRQA